MAGKDDKGTELVPFEKYAVASFSQDDLREALEANLGGGQGVNLTQQLDRIKVPGSGGLQWTIPTLEGEEVTSEFTGVICEFKQVRTYWLTTFDENPNVPPDCTSDDTLRGIGIRHPDQEHASSQACASCPHAQWGSGKNGGQACAENRLLFMLSPDDMLPYIVKLPPTSLKAAASYFMGLTRKGKPFYSVQTALTLERTKNDGGIDYSEVRFKKVADLSPEDAAKVKAYRTALAPAVASAQAFSPVEQTD